MMGDQFAVLHAGEWHIATWDRDCFEIHEGLQRGDRWAPRHVSAVIPLPALPVDFNQFGVGGDYDEAFVWCLKCNMTSAQQPVRTVSDALHAAANHTCQNALTA